MGKKSKKMYVLRQIVAIIKNKQLDFDIFAQTNKRSNLSCFFDNFKKILTLTQFAPTFGKILVWNFLWAVASTALNYFAGLGLSLLLDKDCVKGKVIWRAFPVLAYAIRTF